MEMSGDAPLCPDSSYPRRLRLHRQTRPMRQGSPQSTESLLPDRRTSCADLENAHHRIPLVTLGEPASTVPDYIRSMLRLGLACGWGCPHVLQRPRSCGKIGWRVDAINIATARLSYMYLNRGHLDDRIPTRILSDHPVRWLTNLRVLCGDRWYVDANQLLLAREIGIIGKLPELSTEQVSDLSNEDVLVKLLAVSQITWLCLQLGMRLGQGVPTTQLETMTMGYALCSAITYFLLIDRPKDVTTVSQVEAARYPASHEMSSIASIGPDALGFFRSTVSLPNNSTHQHGSSLEVGLGSSFAVIVFGSLHFAAWNYEFPTPTERTLWRASTVLTITVLPVMFILSFSASRFNAIIKSVGLRGFLVSVRFWILAPLFIAARLFILVEVIRSLAYQPPGSYKTTWAAYVPHVG
jgi:hypothetical protein